MPTRWLLATLVAVLLSPSLLPAQVRSVSPRNLHERILCIVPMIGAGTPKDPRRPLPAPVILPSAKPTRTGVFGFSYQLSDDGHFAILELLADRTAAFPTLLSTPGVVKVFDRLTAKKSDIEVECQKYKKDFSLDHFGMGVR